MDPKIPKKVFFFPHVCHGQARRVFLGDGSPPTFNSRNPYFMGPYKPLRTWVDEFIPEKYGNNGSLDPGTCKNKRIFFCWGESILRPATRYRFQTYQQQYVSIDINTWMVPF